MNIFDNILSKATTKFKRYSNDFNKYFSPGRVNLIGEHIDYNGGMVLPCSIDLGTYGVVCKRTDELVRCYSENFDSQGIVEFVIDELNYDENHGWVNYVKGIIKEMQVDGYVFNNGFDLYIKGLIPIGGLSSSASLELLVGVIMRDLYYLDYSNIDLALLGQRCEHNFIGVKCGIMDQFAIAMGKKNKAMLLNTNSLDYKYVEADFADYKVIIGNTNYKRTLADSKYNERRSQCEQGLKILKEYVNIQNLCDLSVEQFELLKDNITDDVIKRRVKHCIYENDRTKKAVEALEKHDYQEFGKLLVASHYSLKNDFEVTGLALDSLVDAFLSFNVAGARMTGGGFGGSMIALVHQDEIEKILPEVNKKYNALTGLNADFYIVNVEDGARKIEVNDENKLLD